MLLQFENESDIPVESKDSFVPFEQDGKQVFMHKDLAESKKTAFRHQGQLTNLTKDFETFKSGITVKQEEATASAKLAQETALQEQMDKLKSDGKTSELHVLEMQQLQDKLNVSQESNESYKEKYSILEQSLVEKDKTDLATKIAIEFVPAEMVPSFSKLLKMDRIKSVEGKVVFTNASGEAVDNDPERWIEILNKDPELKQFAKFPGSKGGYGGKGGSGGGDGKTMSRGAFNQLSSHEKSTKMRAGIKIID